MSDLRNERLEDHTSRTGSSVSSTVSGASMNPLIAALQYSTKLVIVTCAGEGWVQTSCAAGMLALSPSLGFCEVASARAQWSRSASRPSGVGNTEHSAQPFLAATQEALGQMR